MNKKYVRIVAIALALIMLAAVVVSVISTIAAS